MIIPFLKMHGCGNDFIVINEFETFIPEGKKSEFSKLACTRHFSVGADGAIFVCRPQREGADIKMRVFNADGSEAPMCGNGIRILTKFAIDNNLVPKKEHLDVETKAGMIRAYSKYLDDKVISVRVDLGTPKIRLVEIPAVGTGEVMIKEKINVPGFGALEITGVNTGAPHAAIFVDNVERVDVERIGKAVRHLTSVFPLGINVNFVEVVSHDHLKVRTYERGVEAETLACGTGICASAVAAFLVNKIPANIPVTIEARGGSLIAEVSGSGGVPDMRLTSITSFRVYMEGPADYAFKGELEFET